MTKKPTKIPGFVKLSSEEAEKIGGMFRVSPGKVKQVAGKGVVEWMKPAHEQTLVGPAVIKVGLSSKKGKRVHFGVQQVKDGLQIINKYKKAGYDISGVTRDGVVIVAPEGRPDSFSLDQLDKALSAVRSKS